jgi:hypothetical protein
VRRTGPREYYAAIADDEQGALVLVRRHAAGVDELARAPLAPGAGPLRIALSATGAGPTVLAASADRGTGAATVTARDDTQALQRAGDPGVLATARTLFPHSGPEVLPALGNLHLLPYGVQEGQAFMQTAVGEQVMNAIRERSTAAFSEIVVRASDGGAGPTATGPGRTAPSVIAASNGSPLVRGGALVRVATDIPARVEIEFARNRNFRRSRRLRPQRTNGFEAVTAELGDLPPGRRIWWRARVKRNGQEVTGPARSFRVMPRAASGEGVSIAVASCASQFGPAFDELAARRPDVFVWQGDLNYPDTIGPLAQTVDGYAGIWRDFLANPLMAPVLEDTLFAVQRDDHDYGLQDANAGNLVQHGLAPWEGLMERRVYYRFSAGLADVWVLDQRYFKSDPAAPDGPDKTLLGPKQREWLMRTLAASKAPFKVICSPCTLAPLATNARDGNWAAGFTAERDLLLKHVAERVGGRTVWVTGDTHWTMAYERDGLLEVRPCPLGIPSPNDITLTQPQVAEDARRVPGVEYANDDRSHFALIETRRDARRPRLDLSLVAEDGSVPWRRSLV